MNVMHCCQTGLSQLVAEEMSDWIWMDGILHPLKVSTWITAIPGPSDIFYLHQKARPYQ